MKKLLTFEFRKLSRQKSFYVCGALAVAFVFLSAALTKLIVQNSEDATLTLPSAVDTLASALQGANATLLIGIFTALFVCTDHSDGTIKNIYSKGYTRTSVYFSKFAVVIAAATLFCLATWCGGILSGAVLFENIGAFDLKLVLSLVAQLLVVFVYTCMYFALSSVLRKTGGSIAACIVCPMIVSLLFTTISSIVNIESFDLSDYWLDGLFGSLSQASVSGKTALTSIVLSLVYGAVFTSVGVIVSNRQTV